MQRPASSYRNCAEFRFYEELNDFIPLAQQKRSLTYRFNGMPGIKDPIEALGVPHTEVDLIIVNGESAGFDYKLQHGDRVAVYPAFRRFDISSLSKLRHQPVHNTTFVADVNLGKLARLLRLFGCDTLFANHISDKEIVEIAENQQRIVLTRDRRLLFAKKVTHGYWVRSVFPEQQLIEVVHRFDLANKLMPFNRCTICNGLIAKVSKAEVLPLLKPKTKCYYDHFYRCLDCGKIYWEGSHIDKIKTRFAHFFPFGQPDKTHN